MQNIRAEGRDVVLPAGQYFFQQMLLVGPPSALIWIPGLFALFTWQRLKPYRVLGWSYLVCYLVFFALHGKSYYLAPIYSMLLAAGATVIESALTRPRVAWLKPAMLGSTITIDSRPFTVIGILPQGFTGTTQVFAPEIWLPLGVYDQVANDFETENKDKLDDRGGRQLMIVGRLKAGMIAAAAGPATQRAIRRRPGAAGRTGAIE